MGTEKVQKSSKLVSMTVNGEWVERTIDAPLTLAEFLREQLDLTGTKVGCNRGECGSCTVIADGLAVYSMLTVDASAKMSTPGRS